MESDGLTSCGWSDVLQSDQEDRGDWSIHTFSRPLDGELMAFGDSKLSNELIFRNE